MAIRICCHHAGIKPRLVSAARPGIMTGSTIVTNGNRHEITFPY
jgi:hypothetical protein